MKLEKVFESVTVHNQHHVKGFTSEALRLLVRSKHVQNMFFVDLPGIIIAKGPGEDNREAIQKILREESKVENTKLLILLEPKEYATNSIIEFVDSSLGADRKKQALFLMTKFDLRARDSLTGSKSNRFLDDYWRNDIKPFMVINPTMQRSADSMSTDEHFKRRQELIQHANKSERESFDQWRETMSQEFKKDPKSEELDDKFEPYIGFSSAVREMHRFLLEDTRSRLPQVLCDLSRKRDQAVQELQVVQQVEQFADESKIQVNMAKVLSNLASRINSYLDGSLEVAAKLPHLRQTLHEEVDGEEDSTWAMRPLNHLEEEDWRNHVAEMVGKDGWPSSIQPEEKFLGGKQYQRALYFFQALLMDRFPDPRELKPYVRNAVGVLRGGLGREDWEHACVAIIQHLLRKVSEAGINFFVKHVLYIFQRLFSVAFEDLKEGETDSMVFKHLPERLRTWAFQRYDEMLWKIGVEAVASCHQSVAPYYSTVIPALPMLKIRPVQSEAPLRENNSEETYDVTDRLNLRELHSSWKWLHQNPELGGSDVHTACHNQATERVDFLPSERAQMMCADEEDVILDKAREYNKGLFTLIVINLEFNFHHHLFLEFKRKLQSGGTGFFLNAEALAKVNTIAATAP